MLRSGTVISDLKAAILKNSPIAKSKEEFEDCMGEGLGEHIARVEVFSKALLEVLIGNIKVAAIEKQEDFDTVVRMLTRQYNLSLLHAIR